MRPPPGRARAKVGLGPSSGAPSFHHPAVRIRSGEVGGVRVVLVSLQGVAAIVRRDDTLLQAVDLVAEAPDGGESGAEGRSRGDRGSALARPSTARSDVSRTSTDGPYDQDSAPGGPSAVRGVTPATPHRPQLHRSACSLTTPTASTRRAHTLQGVAMAPLAVAPTTRPLPGSDPAV